MAPPNCTHPRNQAHPVGREDKDEHGCKEPERSVNQVPANDAFQKPVQTLDEPFAEVLCSLRDLLHVPRGDLGEHDQAGSHDPGDDHGVGDREAEETDDLVGLLRQTVCRRLLTRPHAAATFASVTIGRRVNQRRRRQLRTRVRREHPMVLSARQHRSQEQHCHHDPQSRTARARSRIDVLPVR